MRWVVYDAGWQYRDVAKKHSTKRRGYERRAIGRIEAIAFILGYTELERGEDCIIETKDGEELLLTLPVVCELAGIEQPLAAVRRVLLMNTLEHEQGRDLLQRMLTELHSDLDPEAREQAVFLLRETADKEAILLTP